MDRIVFFRLQLFVTRLVWIQNLLTHGPNPMEAIMEDEEKCDYFLLVSVCSDLSFYSYISN